MVATNHAPFFHFVMYRHYRITSTKGGFTVLSRVFPTVEACRTYVDHLPTDEHGDLVTY